MEYLDGEDLDQRLRRRGSLSVDEAIDFATQVCEAMAEAHALGIIHRDLKPSNFFFAATSRRSAAREGARLRHSKVAERSGRSRRQQDANDGGAGLAYVHVPEQMQATRDVDARTDIWALGVILYELLTGTVPFDGDGLAELYVNIANGTPPRMRRSDVPDELESVILRCLAKSRDERYPDVAELALALAPFGPPCARASALRRGRSRRPRGFDPRRARAW